MPTTTGLATSFITFSRPGASGGGATTTDRDGKIKWAGHNLLTNSESFDAAAWTKSLFPATANQTAAPSGTTTADAVVPATDLGVHQLYQNVTVPSGVPFTMGLFVKPNGYTKFALVENQTTGYYVTYNASGSGSVITESSATGTITPLANGWYYVTHRSTSGGTTYRFSLIALPNSYTSGDFSGAWSGDGTSGMYLWGAHLYRSDLGSMQLNPAMPAGMQSYYPTTPRNQIGYSEDFSSWVASGLTVTANPVVAPNGLQTADTLNVTGGAAAYVYQVMHSNSGLFMASIYAKAGSKTVLQLATNVNAWGVDARANFNLATGTLGTVDASLTAAITPIGDGWYRCSVLRTKTANAGATLIWGVVDDAAAARNANATAGTLHVWGAQLSDSASLDTYVPVYGAAVTSAAYYAPRLDFDGATLSPKGLLVEEARTNLLLYTADFRTTAEAGSTRPWLSPAGATTATVNYAEAPDGTTSATRIVFTASDYPGRSQNVTLEASKPYTFSVWIKRVSGSGSGRVQIEGASVISAVSTIDVSTNWTRYTVTGTSTGAGAATVYIYFEYIAGRTGEYLLWGAQIEQGSFATSYIPNGSAVAGATRAADVASVSTQAFPYSASEGTLVVETQFRGNGGVQAEFGPASPRTVIGSSTLAVAAIQRGGGVVTSSQGVVGIDKVTKSALTLNSGDGQLYVNGTSIGNSSGTTAASYTTLQLGTNPANGEPLNGYIRRVTYIPRRLSNAELAARTA